jgi:hypothetical protein
VHELQSKTGLECCTWIQGLTISTGTKYQHYFSLKEVKMNIAYENVQKNYSLSLFRILKGLNKKLSEITG